MSERAAAQVVRSSASTNYSAMSSRVPGRAPPGRLPTALPPQAKQRWIRRALVRLLLPARSRSCMMLPALRHLTAGVGTPCYHITSVMLPWVSGFHGWTAMLSKLTSIAPRSAGVGRCYHHSQGASGSWKSAMLFFWLQLYHGFAIDFLLAELGLC
jgi:hypothetical protein